MRCKNCGTDVPSAKKCCPNCGKVMSGFTVNNVTGEYGYRDDNGYFHPVDDGEVVLHGGIRLGRPMAWKEGGR